MFCFIQNNNVGYPRPNHEHLLSTCYVMLCYVMLCYVMLCYVMLCNMLINRGYPTMTTQVCATHVLTLQT